MNLIHINGTTKPCVFKLGHVGEKNVEYNRFSIYTDYSYFITIKIAMVHVKNMIVLCNYDRIYKLQFTASS